MVRRARIIIPNTPHHVTQRGNRREPIFFETGDEALYLDLLAEQLKRYNVACWSYCLMPNHVHLILTPQDETGLSRAVGETHRRYTGFVGARGRWTGHLFQGRFASVAMDEDHLMSAFRYVARNPIKANLVANAEGWEWSSTKAIIARTSTPYVNVSPALERIGHFKAFVDAAPNADERWEAILKAGAVGRPVGAIEWLRALEAKYVTTLTPQKRGPKPKA
jgi:putative transposase